LLEILGRKLFDPLSQLTLLLYRQDRAKITQTRHRFLLYLWSTRLLPIQSYTVAGHRISLRLLDLGQWFQILLYADSILILIRIPGTELINLKTEFTDIRNKLIDLVAIPLDCDLPFNVLETERILFRLYSIQL